MIRVDTFSENKFWNKEIKEAHNFFNNIVKNFPQRYQFNKKKINLTVLLSNNKNIKKLNKKFRKKNKPTDILSFPFETRPFFKKEIYLGDIIISYEFMNKPKLLTNIQFKKKLIKIFIHGFLHLLNYDHIKLKDFQKMYKEEKKIYNLINKKIEKFI
jgi:probable rRNA maturation factor